MRKLICLMLLVALCGCKSTTGPLASRQRPQQSDPLLTSIEEKQRYTRERYPIIESDPRVAPNTYSDRYGPTGR